jgi:Ca2+-binding RTX toxin-like protein
VVTGDNGLVLRIGSRTRTTDRLGSTAGTRMDSRSIQLFDLNGPNFLTAGPANRYGNDLVSGGAGVDVEYGQDGNDAVSGGPGADYMEGNGGADNLRGDLTLADPSGRVAVPALATVWPGTASALDQLEGTGADGQDDQVGGSGIAAFRDGADSIEGNGAADFQLGDNGTMARDVQGTDGSATERKFVERYPSGPLPADATVVRVHDPAVPNANGTMRFCSNLQTTCEVAGASGNDTMWGDDGTDSMWGQDGDDVMRGGAGNDDMFGELGNDQMFGEAGEDAMLGDRGGVVNQYINPDDSSLGFTQALNSTPKESYTGFPQGAYDRRIDLLHDIDGDQWVGAANSTAMPHPGLNEGGDDRIRGGLDPDNIHAGWGDDLANGDSGGDQVFGDDGADALWGGDGCDPVANAATPDCLTNGTFDATSRGTNDRFIDHIFGGVGGNTPVDQKSASGSDVIDYRPRGLPSDCTTGPWPVTTTNKKVLTTNDPCAWFQMTSTDNDTADPATLLDNQHHGGTDWIYGGWDRDVMEGDVAQNGPNPGDRLLDWNGAYNLYVHCNAAYGGYNDVRLHSPDWQAFLQQLAWGTGAGRSSTDASTSGLSAYRELALGYPGETDHTSGGAYPSTPGHFDEPTCNP